MELSGNFGIPSTRAARSVPLQYTSWESQREQIVVGNERALPVSQRRVSVCFAIDVELRAGARSECFSFPAFRTDQARMFALASNSEPALT